MKRKGIGESILVVSSWMGNLVLTGLAFALAFTNKEPLSPILFLTVAGCILAGNSLPIAVYALKIYRERGFLKAESTVASDRLRSVLIDAREIEESLKEIRDTSAKSILIGRQIPERVKESLQEFEKSLSKLEQFEGQEPSSVYEALPSEIKELSDRIGKLETSISSTKHEPKLEIDLSELTGRLDDLKGQLDDLRTQVTNIEVKVPQSAEKPEPSKKAAQAKKKPRTSGKKAGTGDNRQEELLIQDDNIINPRVSTIRASAMIGISHKLYIRGDGPHLSWETGSLMNPTGIGEYQFELEGLEGDCAFRMYLDDETPCEEENLKISASETLLVKPTFPALPE